MQRPSGRISFSEESQGWLTAALDPFHDFQYEVEGLPDERSAPSMVQIHNQSYTLTAPTSAAGATWDASVLYTGFNSVINETPGSGMITVTGSAVVHRYNHGALSTGTPFGSLNIWAGAAGSVMSTGAPGTIGDTEVSLGSVLSTDRCRLIGVGVEIHNTTAEVYRQGSLTVAQLPDVASDNFNVCYMDTNAAPYKDTSAQADRAFIQASTLPPLMSVPGASTWPASEGVYAVPRMVFVPRDIYLYGTSATPGASSRIPVLYGTDGKIASPEPKGCVSVAAGYEQTLFSARAPSGWSPLQVWFSGLSSQTTLTITYRTIVEYFPALGSPLLPTARPSPVFDPAALGCYSAVITEAPYAVPVNQNAAGEYFRKVLQILANATTISSPLFGAYAPLVASIGAAGQTLLKAWPEKKEKNPPGRRVRRDEAGPRSLQTKQK